jgi:hypothetical protein
MKMVRKKFKIGLSLDFMKRNIDPLVKQRVRLCFQIPFQTNKKGL